jgi:hypothetical protein
MLFNANNRFITKQKGVATLVTVVVLLVITTITAFTISSSIVQEKQVLADEQRAIAAFEAAQSGLAHGIDHYRKNVDLPAEINAVSGALTSGSFEKWYFWGVSSANSSDGIDWELHAKGESDDKSVTRFVSMKIDYAKLDLPDAPLVAAAGVDGGGNYTVTNKTGFTTIWTGGQLNITSSAFTTKVPSPANIDVLIESTNSGVQGVDIIDSDPNLASLDLDDFERAFLGSDVDTFCDNTFIDQADSSIDFKASLQSAGSLVCLTDSVGDPITIPTHTFTAQEDGPQSIYIIKGDLAKANSNSMKGLIFVTGNISTLTGNSPFYGTVMAYGSIGTNEPGEGGAKGTGEIIFDSKYTSDLGDSFTATAITGSWRDWNE